MSTKQNGLKVGTQSPELIGSSIRPNVIEVGRLFYVQDLNDEYFRTIAICVGSENAQLVERALNALRSNVELRGGMKGRSVNALVRTLYLIRGVPGSGKTTYAKTLGIADHYEADMWFDANGGYCPEKLNQAHEWCQRMAAEAMEAGRPCVVSNTFTRLWEMEYYKSVAKRLGYEVREVVMHGEWPNVHGVPEDKVRQMRERFEYANTGRQVQCEKDEAGV